MTGPDMCSATQMRQADTVFADWLRARLRRRTRCVRRLTCQIPSGNSYKRARTPSP